MDIRSKEIKAETGMFDAQWLKAIAEGCNPLPIMDVVSPTLNVQMEFYLLCGRLYYINRNKYRIFSPKAMTTADFIFGAEAVTINTMFHLRTCFKWGFKSKKVEHFENLSASNIDFKYASRITYETINSTIIVYGYSNVSDWFAANKAKEFIDPLLSICNSINYEIDKGYDPLNDPMPTKLLLEIKKVIM